LICIFVVLAVWGLTYLINETPFMYRTPDEYKLPEEKALVSKACMPIMEFNGKSDEIIIFLPGFKGIPGQFEYLAKIFSDTYNVAVPLYPGSGTSPDDFEKTYFSQWYSCARDTYLECRRKYRRVYLCGFSMGGIIALKLAEDFSASKAFNPDGIISISTPVFSNNLLGEHVYYDWRIYFIRYISWIFKRMKKEPDRDILISRVPEEYDQEHFFGSIYSLKMGVYETKNNLSKITAPIFLMHAKGDTYAPFQNMHFIAEHVESEIIRARFFDLRGKHWDMHTRHFLPQYEETRDQVIGEMKEFLRSLK
jgi:carboxylesterase